jgi:hypothetical protein
MTFADVRERCEHSADIATTLDVVATDASGWISVMRCRVCGSLWAREYPFGEMHGGGPACFYRISTTDPARWLATESGLTTRLRSADEDQRFFATLGAEIGPELCRHPGCTHKHIQFSVMCRLHHFEMITKRAYPYATNEA